MTEHQDPRQPYRVFMVSFRVFSYEGFNPPDLEFNMHSAGLSWFKVGAPNPIPVGDTKPP